MSRCSKLCITIITGFFLSFLPVPAVTAAYAVEEPLDLGNEIIYRASLGRADDVKLLVSQGASPDQKNGSGIPIIAVAAQRLDPEGINVVKALIEVGANVNLRDSKGQTALFYAAKSGNADIAYVLLLNKADLYALDANGDVALAYARKYGHQNVIDAIEKYKALPPEPEKPKVQEPAPNKQLPDAASPPSVTPDPAQASPDRPDNTQDKDVQAMHEEMAKEQQAMKDESLPPAPAPASAPAPAAVAAVPAEKSAVSVPPETDKADITDNPKMDVSVTGTVSAQADAAKAESAETENAPKEAAPVPDNEPQAVEENTAGKEAGAAAETDQKNAGNAVPEEDNLIITQPKTMVISVKEKPPLSTVVQPVTQAPLAAQPQREEDIDGFLLGADGDGYSGAGDYPQISEEEMKRKLEMRREDNAEARQFRQQLAIQREQEIRQIAYEISYHTCAFQYWSFCEQVRQKTELSSEELTIAIQSHKEQVMELQKRLLYDYQLRNEPINSVIRSSQVRIHKQLNSMPSKQVRRQNNVGKMDDMQKRCGEIGRQWGVSVPSYVQETEDDMRAYRDGGGAVTTFGSGAASKPAKKSLYKGQPSGSQWAPRTGGKGGNLPRATGGAPKVTLPSGP